MTFSAQIKEELASVEIKNIECALAECCGMVFFSNATKSNRIKIITENKNVAFRASSLLKSLFGFDFDKKFIPANALKKFNLIVEHESRVDEIFASFGIDNEFSSSFHLNAAIVESDETRAAFCRGAFLTGGSVTDPASRYHLELSTSHTALSREVVALLLELDLSAKATTRKSNNIIYLKESGQIEDFLTRIGAPLSALSLMQTKLYKDVRNNINRQVNFEVANLSKTADAASVHISAIKTIIEHGRFESLPPSLQAAAKLRLDNPDTSLSALAKLSEDGIGKSGLNHRLNKLVLIADEINGKDTK